MMKTLDQFRMTPRFSILGIDMEHVASALEFFREKGISVVGIANEKDFGRYVVRVVHRRNITDYLIDAACEVRVIEFVQILGETPALESATQKFHVGDVVMDRMSRKATITGIIHNDGHVVYVANGTIYRDDELAQA